MAGLTAAELAQVIVELRAQWLPAEIVDCALLHERDDLLLFAGHGSAKLALHIAPGGARARLAPTRRRFRKEQLATGPRVDRLRELLVGATLSGIEQVAGERRCVLLLARDSGRLELIVELFGPRGFWGVVDAGGTLLATSRLGKRGDAELAPGHRYRPPTGAPPGDEPPPRFSSPAGEAIDAHFTALDVEQERHAERDALRRALDRTISKLTTRAEQLRTQQAEANEAETLRLHADLLLAYGFGPAAGSGVLEVPHPDRPDERVRIERLRGVPVQEQARALYRRARKLADGRAITEQRLRETEQRLLALRTVAPRLDDESAPVPALTDELRALGVPLPHALREATSPGTAKLRKETGGEAFRRFTSAEGYPIWVGRDNAQNDRLTRATAHGNDLWLHVGESRAGSHVVVRLPRGKTASLETLLDAATLAVHFSKARGAPRCDVIYTQAKHVRKPKGAPAGRVLPGHTKTITVRLDERRLRRLLDGGAV